MNRCPWRIDPGPARPTNRPGDARPLTVMSSDLSIDDRDWPAHEQPESRADDGLVATVVQYAEIPDECTIHPVGPSEDELMTCWITALEDSFVSLPESR
jgi:hypothetical protein